MNIPRPPSPSLPARQRGAIAVMFAVAALTLLSMAGLVLDLAQAYNRKLELQTLADAVALAAARELNGTASGVANAVSTAATTAAGFRYQYNRTPVPWSAAALRFAAAPGTTDSGWSDAAGAAAAPAAMLYAKVDTGALDSALGSIATLFWRAAGNVPATLRVAGRAVAGRLTIPVTPLAICAQSATPAAARANSANPAYNELVEFGFRRGVGYNLMNLNPNGATPENFLIDPLSAPGVAGAPGNFAISVVAPFVCAGTMLMPGVTGGTLNVQRNFPLASLYQQLNSRFDLYTTGSGCLPEPAPPDRNIKQYLFSSITWMSPAAAAQSAASWTSGGVKLWTRADPLPGDASNTAAQYGPLWAYAKAVPYSAYTASPVEPAAGYSAFGTSAWSSLYTPGPPAASGYPAATGSATPYSSGAGSNFLAPAAARQPGLAGRRVLNVALLACPVPAGASATATVLGVGRFFMTVQASTTSIHAEFAGVAPPASLSGTVGLLP
ncbi:MULTISPECIES: pilus assembly protein TadG-related protein [unclassified Duganella]|uniref:pilus assembly protein TadG-related protein n=1 Tax=unclassified Duganella TaxID=2636909 RepID=UPI000B845C23|nr:MULTISPECIES: pilus assembly protein TadG-related protein [unclassified Duganella]